MEKARQTSEIWTHITIKQTLKLSRQRGSCTGRRIRCLCNWFVTIRMRWWFVGSPWPWKRARWLYAGCMHFLMPLLQIRLYGQNNYISSSDDGSAAEWCTKRCLNVWEERIHSNVRSVFINYVNPSSAKCKIYIFSPTWSCVSLPRPTTSSGWKYICHLFETGKCDSNASSYM